ncbi:hypothetical protein PGTUg99_025308 [Puccinia graminis f. sp. tritici]|uniref:Uncharacterized protein n=1 Tax=Puccinia graminis f. sp. tritici TaxID=56615 RepID=A0A5B0NX79_PUCGR|nr:hypothetical protein PGTUg99_025308 [Puccinia graminis f. sp. tritici]
MLFQFVLITAWYISTSFGSTNVATTNETGVGGIMIQYSSFAGKYHKGKPSKNFNCFSEESTSSDNPAGKETQKEYWEGRLAHQRVKPSIDKTKFEAFCNKMRQSKEQLNLLKEETEDLQQENRFFEIRIEGSDSPKKFSKLSDFLAKSKDFISIFKKLNFCKILGVNPNFSKMQYLISLLQQDQNHAQFLKDLPDAAFQSIANHTWRKLGSDYINEIKELITYHGIDREDLKTWKYEDFKFHDLVKYLFQTIDYLFKNGFIEKEIIISLFQDDEVLLLAIHHIISRLNHHLPSHVVMSSGTDFTESWFWPYDFDFLSALCKKNEDRINLDILI